MGRDVLQKQLPQLEITLGNLSLGWFSLDVQDIAVKPKGYDGMPLKVKSVHVSFNPWELAHKKVKDIVIKGIDITLAPDDPQNKMILALLHPSTSNTTIPQPSVSSTASAHKPVAPFSFKTIKVRDLNTIVKKGSNDYKALVNFDVAPTPKGSMGHGEINLTSPFGTIHSVASFTILDRLSGELVLTAPEIYHDAIKIESPKIILKLKDQAFNHLNGKAVIDIAAIRYEYVAQGLKIPLRIPKGHLEGPIHISLHPNQKIASHLIGELGGTSLDLDGHYDVRMSSGQINLKPILIPLQAPWLQGLLPQLSPQILDLKSLDGALAFHSSVDIVKGTVKPHYSIKVNDTGKVVTLVVQNALKDTLKGAVDLPENAVNAVGSVLGKIFS